MASSPLVALALAIFASSLLCFPSSSSALRPHGLVLPVRKDAATLQYVTRVLQRTPSKLINLVVDLGDRYTWVDCRKKYVSSTYRPVACDAAVCTGRNGQANCGSICFSKPAPGCNNNSCTVNPENHIIRMGTMGELADDVLSLSSTDGSSTGPLIVDPHFIFSCPLPWVNLVKGLAKGANGVLALGRHRIAAPLQLSAAFGFRSKFALCLSASTTSDGVIFFGDGPYKFLPSGLDISQGLMYTPLLVNPVSTGVVYASGEKSVDHFIGVTSIKVNNKPVPVNKSLLSFDKNGVGGTKLSTVHGYTALETSIYKAVVTAFSAALAGVPKVAPVKPFGLCFDASKVGSTRVGPAVPAIDLVLQNDSAIWRIFGANSMVNAGSNALCLAFVDGGTNSRTSIVIGGHQLENNLLQFDLKASKLGFSSSLLFRQTACGNFNFKSSA